MVSVQITGRLGNDAEVRDAAGKKVISFSVGTTKEWKDRNGQPQETTTWVRCSWWKDADKTRVADFLRKGTQVLVIGEPHAKGYQNKQGEIGASLELTVGFLELLGSPKDAGDPQPKAKNASKAQPQDYQQPDDDLPF
jgi:single-strand DNA-binding protein